MVSVVAYDRDKSERERIRESCWEQVSRYPREDMKFLEIGNGKAFREQLVSGDSWSLLYYEFVKGQDVSELRETRKGHEETMIMLLTDLSTSPMEYLKPGVAPDSILLRPYTREQMRKTNEEFIRSFMDKASDQDEEKFLIENKGERVLLPYNRICYFEAREKKTFVRVGMTEYAVYKTLGVLETALPAQFKRCHRSYIVNSGLVNKVNLTDSYLILEDGIEIPVSKTYKQEFRRLLK